MHQSPESDRGNILVVDDVLENLEILRQVLTEAGMNVRCAPNGRTPLMMAAKITPDLVLLDIRMPEMDGLEVCKKFKELPGCDDVPIIFISALKDPDGIAESLGVGGVDYITKPFNVKEVLARISTHLKLYQLQQQLEEQNQRLQSTLLELRQAKSEFLANMSHEIRTPLNAVLGFAEILKRQERDSLKIHYIDSIQSAGGSLLSLINDVLDLSKIEAGKLELSYSAVSPEVFCHEMTTIFSQKAQEKGLDFSIELAEGVPQLLIMDELRIRQILINLIGNALKFTEQGYVKIGIDAVLTETDSRSRVELMIEIRDSGIGIPPSQQATIFDVFEQVQKSKKKKGGTGLGLAITKRLVEMMRGSITLESKVGHGAVFRIHFHGVEIAAGKLEKFLSAQQEQEKIAFEPATILIVDDIDYNREILTVFLEGYPFSFFYAENGREAISQTQKHHPNLIMLDMKMPEMDGYEALKKLKADPALNSIPIIAVTASALKQDEERILKSCDSYLRKPVSAVDLIHEIQRFLPYRIVEVPKVPVPATASVVAEPPSRQGLPQGRILLAEDNEINQEVAVALLEDVGVQVTIANNGQEAVELVRQNDFDLVLMDLQMPVMDGLAATREIRQLDKPGSDSLPILAMSAGDWQNDKKACLAAGMNGHLCEPIEPDQLRISLAKHLTEPG